MSKKNSDPKVNLYYLPKTDNYNLSLSQNEVDNYFSNDMSYLIQKLQSGNFKIYTLYGCNEQVEFKNQLSNFIDESKIAEFEFMNDCLLVFLKDDNSSVVMINLYKNMSRIENLKVASSQYEIICSKYDKLGKNEGVKATLVVDVGL